MIKPQFFCRNVFSGIDIKSVPKLQYKYLDSIEMYFCGCFQTAYSEFRAQRIKCFHKFLQINLFYTFEHICHVRNNNLYYSDTVLAKSASTPPFFFCL